MPDPHAPHTLWCARRLAPVPSDWLSPGDHILSPDGQLRTVTGKTEERAHHWISGPHHITLPESLRLLGAQNGHWHPLSLDGGQAVPSGYNDAHNTAALLGCQDDIRKQLQGDLQQLRSLPPALLGLWLGSGGDINAAFHSPTVHGQQYLREFAERHGLTLRQRGHRWTLLSSSDRNPLRTQLLNQRRLSLPYLRASRDAREALLGSWIEQAGHATNDGIFLKVKPRLISDAQRLVSSLGVQTILAAGGLELSGLQLRRPLEHAPSVQTRLREAIWHAAPAEQFSTRVTVTPAGPAVLGSGHATWLSA